MRAWKGGGANRPPLPLFLNLLSHHTPKVLCFADEPSLFIFYFFSHHKKLGRILPLPFVNHRPASEVSCMSMEILCAFVLFRDFLMAPEHPLKIVRSTSILTSSYVHHLTHTHTHTHTQTNKCTHTLTYTYALQHEHTHS